MRVGIVADDLTGAGDTAVQLARRGWPTLLLRPDAVPPGDPRVQAAGVVAVSTGSRALGPGAAAATAAAVERLRAGGVDRLYLKVDSTLRGAVAAQVAGALDAWQRDHPGATAVVCPAYPAMGRTVVGGVARDGGRLLQDGPAGRDPVTPVTTSVLAELLPGSAPVPLPADRDAAALAADLRRRGDRARVLTVDARDDADLALLAGALARLGPEVVPVGSAGLAGALAACWRPDGPAAPGPAAAAGSGPILVLVTSRHRVALEQVERLREDAAGDLLHLAPDLADLADGASARARLHLPAGGAPGVVLVTAPRELDQHADAAGAVAARLAALLADLHADLAERSPARAVVVVGGDGAAALLDRWSCTGISVVGAVDEGVPHGVLVGGDADGLPVVTKAGGFGDAGALARAVRSARADLSTP